ncbi:MAG: HD domain-containing protein [Flammeovirgaceae bacterium]
MEQYKLAVDIAQDLLTNHIDSSYVYHNYQHTLNVVHAATIIGFHSELAANDLELLHIAAWFHDVGYCVGYEDHEKQSVQIARKILSTLDFSAEQLYEVEAAILATTMPQQPTTELGKILCDADLFHLSQPEYEASAELLRKEFALTRNLQFNAEEWVGCNEKFIKNHRYHTAYAKQHLEIRKQENLRKLCEKKKVSV